MSRTFLLAGLLILIASLALLPGNAVAISNCGVGLKATTTPMTIDGDSGEWNSSNSSSIISTDPCFETLENLDGIFTDLDVQVQSTRYQRSGQWYYAFLFTVDDTTDTGPCLGGSVCKGEQIILQFNRDIFDPGRAEDCAFTPTDENCDASLADRDRQLRIKHAWASDGSGNISIESLVLYGRKDSSAFCSDITWNIDAALSAAGITAVVKRKSSGTNGYLVELELPASVLEIPAADVERDIGVAFAVINDWGTSSSSLPTFEGVCSDDETDAICAAGGAGFPSGLDVNNLHNPVDVGCSTVWIEPDTWGVGYWNEPPADVTIGHGPAVFNSNAIKAYPCFEFDPNDPRAPAPDENYVYYPNVPCKVTVRGEIENQGATAERSILYLWRARGVTEDNETYRFIDLRENAVIPDTALEPVDSLLWNNVPTGGTAHPCIRVVVLPDDLELLENPAFPGQNLRQIVQQPVQTFDYVDSWKSAFGIGAQHIANKNISRHATETDCPHGCPTIGSLKNLGPGNDFLFDLGVIPSAQAQSSVVVAGDPDGGSVSQDRSAFGLSESDWKRIGKDNVVVQVKSYVHLPSTIKPRYDFFDLDGGIIQVYPIEAVMSGEQLPLDFEAFNNHDQEAVYWLQTATYIPPGAEDVTLNIDIGEKLLKLAPRQTVIVEGAVSHTTPPINWLLIIIIILVLLFLIIWFRRGTNP